MARKYIFNIISIFLNLFVTFVSTNLKLNIKIIIITIILNISINLSFLTSSFLRLLFIFFFIITISYLFSSFLLMIIIFLRLYKLINSLLNLILFILFLRLLIFINFSIAFWLCYLNKSASTCSFMARNYKYKYISQTLFVNNFVTPIIILRRRHIL